jgi:L-iditol 2-dehydrogenase
VRAAILQSPRKIVLREVAMPEPQFGELRIKLKAVGVCGSDVHLYLGHRILDRPSIIGHEGIGYIDKLGDGVNHLQVGDRVVIEPNIPCMHCRFCETGRGNICINKKVTGLNQPGCFAEYVILPAKHAWKLSDAISDQNAVTIEPAAVALHALFVSKAQPGDTIAVIGLGAIGLLLTHLAIAFGYKVMVTEVNPSKLKIAKELGAIDACEGLAITNETLADKWNHHNAVAIFECAGSDHSVSLATAAAPRGSEIILLGLSTHPATFQPLRLVREGISILPSIVYDHPVDFQHTIQLIESKKINPSFIISRYMPLADLPSAFEIAVKGDDSKIIINI